MLLFPRKEGQAPVEQIGNVVVISYPSPSYIGIKDVLPFTGIYRMIDANIYHSHETVLRHYFSADSYAE